MTITELYEAVEHARREQRSIIITSRWVSSRLTTRRDYIVHILILVSPLFIPRLRPPKLYLPIDLLRRLRKFL